MAATEQAKPWCECDDARDCRALKGDLASSHQCRFAAAPVAARFFAAAIADQFGLAIYERDGYAAPRTVCSLVRPADAALILAALNAEQTALQAIAKELGVPNTDLLNILQAIDQLKDAEQPARGDETLLPFLKNNPVASEFTPYAYLSSEADAVTVCLEGAADYSKPIGDGITLNLAIDDGRVVGCRIDGVRQWLNSRSAAATDEVAAPKQASDAPRKGQFEAGEPGHKLGSGVAVEHAGERCGDWETEFDKQFAYRNINGLHVLVHTDAHGEQWSSSDQHVKAFIRTVVAEYESRYCDLDEKFVRLDIELIEAEREIARRDERYGWFLQGSVDGLVDTVLDLRYQVKTRDATIATLQSQAAEARLAP